MHWLPIYNIKIGNNSISIKKSENEQMVAKHDHYKSVRMNETTTKNAERILKGVLA